MKRSGFARPQLERKPVIYTPVPEQHRRSVSFGPAELAAAPKNPPGRSQAFRDLARGQACMLRVPGVCCGNPETTVLAHSNQGRHGKGLGMKSNDAQGVWACYTCHAWLDQGRAGAEVKQYYWDRADERMLEVLHTLALELSQDGRAAAWALANRI